MDSWSRDFESTITCNTDFLFSGYLVPPKLLRPSESAFETKRFALSTKF